MTEPEAKEAQPQQQPQQQPKKSVKTLEEKRKYNREATRKSREKKARKAIAESTETYDQWWTKNRETLFKTDPQQCKKWRTLSIASLDQIHWLEHGHLVPPDDPDFVDLVTGLDCLDDFIQEHGLLYTNPQFHPDVEGDLWQTQFWRDEKSLTHLCSLNEATKIYATYAFVAGVPAWTVERFKNRVLENNVPNEECWRSGLGAWQYDQKRLEEIKDVSVHDLKPIQPKGKAAKTAGE